MSPPKLRLRALLIDLNGTLHVGPDPTPHAVAALEKLRNARIPFLFCSNSTKESSVSLIGKLRDMGFKAEPEELMTSLGACKSLSEERGLKRPFLLMSPSAREEFESAPLSDSSKAHEDNGEGHDAVILGLHEPSLSYESLNLAFRVLRGEPISRSSSSSSSSSARSECPSSTPPSTSKAKPKPALIAPHAAMYLQSPPTSSLPAGLSMGIGPFVRALELAAETKAEIVGKPTRSFFELAIDQLKSRHAAFMRDVQTSEIGIVGDDVVNDLGEGAEELGLKRFLVKTGKYREGAEDTGHPPDGVYEDFAHLVEELV